MARSDARVNYTDERARAPRGYIVLRKKIILFLSMFSV